MENIKYVFKKVCDCSTCTHCFEDRSVNYEECLMAEKMSDNEFELHWVAGVGDCRYYEEKVCYD